MSVILLPEFEKAENGYYLPEIWFPHTTLATRLNQSQFEKAKKIAGKIKLPKSELTKHGRRKTTSKYICICNLCSESF